MSRCLNFVHLAHWCPSIKYLSLHRWWILPLFILLRCSLRSCFHHHLNLQLRVSTSSLSPSSLTRLHYLFHLSKRKLRLMQCGTGGTWHHWLQHIYLSLPFSGLCSFRFYHSDFWHHSHSRKENHLSYSWITQDNILYFP